MASAVLVRLGLSLACAAVALALAAPAAHAQTAPPDLAPVTVKAMRDPVEKSYRKMVKGMDVFERLHAMAPQAQLRYKLLPRQPGTPLDGVVLKVMGDTVTLNVPIAPDHSFTLPRDQLAWDEDAQVIPNRKTRSMTWRTEIRTPGLPPHTRRLGDLRLECEVGAVADLISEPLSTFGALADLLSGPADLCRGTARRYLLFADKPVFTVTLVHGARRQVVPVDDMYLAQSAERLSDSELTHSDAQSLLDRAFVLPLGDASWPDDTLVVCEAMEGSPAHDEAKPATQGEPTLVRFTSGYQVRVYRLPEGRDGKPQGEFVQLLDPAGRVTKARTRLALPSEDRQRG
jgi:hypothetical protein